MNQLLILCTGNYYRSRYAEIVFNWLAERNRLEWRAFSRGLDPDPRNVGPLSRNTQAALDELGIGYAEYLRLPQEAVESDFAMAQHWVAVKEAEHRPLMSRKFPAWTERVEYWHIHDVDCSGPEEALPLLHLEVVDLVERLSQQRVR